MTRTATTVLWIGIALVVIGGAYYWYVSRNKATPAAGSQTAAIDVAALPGGASSSDAALAQDLSNIDTALSGMSADTAAIDTALNDQPVPQGQ